MNRPRRDAGDHIEVEFLIGDDPFLIVPVTVVEDLAECTLHYLAAGTSFLRRELVDGSPVPRVVSLETYRQLDSHLVKDVWRGSWQLILSRPGRGHSIRLRWREDTGVFRGWYVNLQEPVQRTAGGFTTRDQFLDILVAPDGSWEWKDEAELAEAVEVGRVTANEARDIGAEGERLVADVEARRFPFDDSLLGWKPNPAWRIPELSPR